MNLETKTLPTLLLVNYFCIQETFLKTIVMKNSQRGSQWLDVTSGNVSCTDKLSEAAMRLSIWGAVILQMGIIMHQELPHSPLRRSWTTWPWTINSPNPPPAGQFPSRQHPCRQFPTWIIPTCPKCNPNPFPDRISHGGVAEVWGRILQVRNYLLGNCPRDETQGGLVQGEILEELSGHTVTIRYKGKIKAVDGR